MGATWLDECWIRFIARAVYSRSVYLAESREFKFAVYYLLYYRTRRKSHLTLLSVVKCRMRNDCTTRYIFFGKYFLIQASDTSADTVPPCALHCGSSVWWVFCGVRTQGGARGALLPHAGLTRKAQVRFTKVIDVTCRCGMLNLYLPNRRPAPFSLTTCMSRVLEKKIIIFSNNLLQSPV